MFFSSENEVEKHLRAQIDDRFRADLTVLDGKDVVDVILCRERPSADLFFLEVKLFNPQSGRIGIGSGKGGGFQVEILRRRPTFFETHLRWIVCDNIEDDTQFLFLTSDAIRSHLSGSGLGEKQNNLRLSIFKKEQLLTPNELLDAISDWTSAKLGHVQGD